MSVENGVVGVVDDEVAAVSTVEDKIQSWLMRVNHEDLIPVMYVYKKVNGRNELCGKYYGSDIPDDHSLGMELGSGSYFAALKIPAGNKTKPEQTSFSFTINTVYDELRRKQSFSGVPAVRGGSVAAVPDRSLEAFQEGMKFTAEMFRSMVPQAAPVPPDISKMLLGQYQGFAEVLQENLKKTNQYLHETLKNQVNEPGSDEHDEEEPSNPLLSLIPELLKLLPDLLRNPTIRNVVSAGLSSPTVQQVASNAITRRIVPQAAPAASRAPAVRQVPAQAAPAASRAPAVRQVPAQAAPAASRAPAVRQVSAPAAPAASRAPAGRQVSAPADPEASRVQKPKKSKK